MLKISLLILYLQTVNFGICWSPHDPLILNKKEDKIFFPLYVNKQDATIDSPAAMIYVEPEDKSSSTYTFCKDYSTHGQGLLGLLLKTDSPRNCKWELDFIREQEKDNEKKPIPCGPGAEYEETGYWKYKVYFKLLIDNKTFIQDSYFYCYDHNNSLSTLYAYYDLNNPSLLKNEYLIDEQNYPVPLKKPTYEDPADRDIFTNIYDKQTKFEPYEVAVSEFIPFGHWRRSFYQWNNTAPLVKILRQPWQTFIKNVRTKLADKTEPIRVVSGIYGKRLSSGSIQHLPHSDIPIPLVRWIVLFNENKTKGVALIMHNYAFGEGEPEPTRWCKESQCDNAGLKNVLPTDQYGIKTLIYCCPVSKVALIVSLPKDILPSIEDLLMFEENKE